MRYDQTSFTSRIYTRMQDLSDGLSIWMGFSSSSVNTAITSVNDNSNESHRAFCGSVYVLQGGSNFRVWMKSLIAYDPNFCFKYIESFTFCDFKLKGLKC